MHGCSANQVKALQHLRLSSFLKQTLRHTPIRGCTPIHLIFATSGSASFDLRRKTGEPLTGRQIVMELFPLSLAERTPSPSSLSVCLEESMMFSTLSISAFETRYCRHFNRRLCGSTGADFGKIILSSNGTNKMRIGPLVPGFGVPTTNRKLITSKMMPGIEVPKAQMKTRQSTQNPSGLRLQRVKSR